MLLFRDVDKKVKGKKDKPTDPTVCLSLVCRKQVIFESRGYFNLFYFDQNPLSLEEISESKSVASCSKFILRFVIQ